MVKTLRHSDLVHIWVFISLTQYMDHNFLFETMNKSLTLWSHWYWHIVLQSYVGRADNNHGEKKNCTTVLWNVLF